MITIQDEHHLIQVSVYGEFTLKDYQEFEQVVTSELEAVKSVNLLIDLTQMLGFTLDVAWEDLKFTREHIHDFKRIAVVSDSQWKSWIAWIGAVFTDAEITVFENQAEAQTWLSA